jgi:hypothetical protein
MKVKFVKKTKSENRRLVLDEGFKTIAGVTFYIHGWPLFCLCSESLLGIIRLMYLHFIYFTGSI